MYQIEAYVYIIKMQSYLLKLFTALKSKRFFLWSILSLTLSRIAGTWQPKTTTTTNWLLVSFILVFKSSTSIASVTARTGGRLLPQLCPSSAAVLQRWPQHSKVMHLSLFKLTVLKLSIFILGIRPLNSEGTNKCKLC